MRLLFQPMLALLDQVLKRLEDEFLSAGKGETFNSLQVFLSGEESPPHAAIAEKLGMSESSVKQAIYRLRQRYRELLRAEIALTVATEDEIDEELRYLVKVLRE